jgi:hypothetical protein
MADASVAYFESISQPRKKNDIVKPNQKLEDDAANSRTVLKKLGAAQVTKMALARDPGFKLVDMEQFIVGLTDTVFYWMGNDMRSVSACLCFTEVRNADTEISTTKHSNTGNPLVSIGT